MKKNTLSIITLVVLGFVGFGWFFLKPSGQVSTDTVNVDAFPQGSAHEVRLTQTGYEPEELTIRKGDVVIWRSENNQPFWPASNLHPSHRDYPGGAFDPKEPIKALNSWSFQFNEVGEWKYHDHLAPYYTGIIYVTE